MANVATKGGMENLVITQPLKRPKAIPIRIDTKIAPKTENPTNKSIDSKGIPFFNNPAHTAAVKPNTEPTERSIPAIKTTKVIPTEIQTLTEICLSTFQRLALVINLSDNKLIKRHSKNSAIRDCDFLIIGWFREIVIVVVILVKLILIIYLH